jgi:trigger factor
MSREAISEDIKREVRNRCGFGCVLCGCPLYEYDHIPDYSVTKRHVASEITLLCNYHHSEKTRGLLDVDKVQAADSNPYNLHHGKSKPHPMHYSGHHCIIEIGGSLFSRQYQGPGTTCHAICVDGITLLGFTFEYNTLLLTTKLFDNKGQLVLEIEKAI